MKQEIINIKGMHCGSCVKVIEMELNSLRGVGSIKVILAQDMANVKYNPHEISLDQIKYEINQLGYSTDGTDVSKSNKGRNGNRKAQRPKKEGNTFLQGLMYGLIPHIGCIAFIIGSILGVTVLMNFFKPLLMNRYFFHALVGVSMGFATLSSALYLRKNSLLSWLGVKKKWKYLSIMYGSTIGINLVLFLLIFPLLANVSLDSSAVTGSVVGVAGVGNGMNLGSSTGVNSLTAIKMKVDIPCPGHAPLISNELKSINGVRDIKFSFPNNFAVTYDSEMTSVSEMLALGVFNEYPAEIVH